MPVSTLFPHLKSPKYPKNHPFCRTIYSLWNASKQHIFSIFVEQNHYMLNKAKKYHLTNEKIAKYLGYSSVHSFNNSSAKTRILRAVEKIIEEVEKEIINKINE